jgi:hypothetical protein
MLPGTIELGLEVVSSQSSALKLTQRQRTPTCAYCVHGRTVNVLEANMTDGTSQWTAEVDGVDAIKESQHHDKASQGLPQGSLVSEDCEK